ncbi:MAG: permease [Gloeobacteraceae cyanobacterium ES-bin-144]|nr:permease [Verrucomicrobiales bacterium]
MSDCCNPPPPDDKFDRRALLRSNLKGPLPAASCCPPEALGKTSSCCGSNNVESESSCCGSGHGNLDYVLWVSLTLFLAGVAAHFAAPSAPAWLHVFGHTCYELLVRSWWGLLFGIVAVAVIGKFPRELVAALLGRGGSVSGLFRAVAAGVALDLCNHGILLVGMSLYKRGASLGQTIAFLIASPWNSLSLTLILAALIGWKWMLLFILLSAVVALITGWIADRMVDAGKIPRNPNAIDLPQDYKIGPSISGVLESLKPSVPNYLRLAREGIVGSQMVLRWILFGFVLTGAIRAFVPEAMFQQYFGPTIAGLMLTLLATTLLEVCSEGSSPIAADLLTRASAPGNAFVFLMAGAATDYTEIASLKSTTGSWRASLALPLISTPQVILLGWLINHFGK